MSTTDSLLRSGIPVNTARKIYSQPVLHKHRVLFPPTYRFANVHYEGTEGVAKRARDGSIPTAASMEGVFIDNMNGFVWNDQVHDSVFKHFCRTFFLHFLCRPTADVKPAVQHITEDVTFVSTTCFRRVGS